MKFEEARKFILLKLKTELPSFIKYHSLNHTEDVYSAALRLAKEEHISEGETEILLMAALLHDSGFTLSRENHEEVSCEIARKYLPRFDCTPQQIDSICELIMVTEVPQKPKNHLEEIICDADLDYLGRDDYFERSGYLYSELKEQNKVKDEEEWKKIEAK